MAVRKLLDGTHPEVTAIGAVHDALKKLDPAARTRVLEYVANMFGLPSLASEEERFKTPEIHEQLHVPSPLAAETNQSDDFEGISSVAIKWMKRSGLSASSLSGLFSLGVDEIDLVAKSVPGDNKKERMHSVLLLKGIAAYLSTGVARVTHEQIKEACLHYDAFDTNNFATHLKSFGSEVAGTKDSGYTLTARGLTNATAVIKTLTGAE